MIIKTISCLLRVVSCWFFGFLLVFSIPFVATAAVNTTGTNTTAMLPAFPEAVGFGRFAQGGRGGEVVTVTTLADNGPGSLREALGVRNWINGDVVPRTVVFRIGGTITLRSPLWLSSPYLTIAGQTAPGGGIALRTTGDFDGPTLGINSHNIVIRYLRIRPARAPDDSCCGDGISIRGGYDIIIDHCSISWASDEVVDLWFSPRRVTLQNSIIAGARRDHPGKTSGKGLLVGGHSNQVTLYQNLLAHNQQRNPLIITEDDSVFQVVNNVIYNWRYFGSEFIGAPGTTRVNLIANTYLSGPETRLDRYEVLVAAGAQLFLQGNTGPHRRSLWIDDWTMVGAHTPGYNSPASPVLQANRAFSGVAIPVRPAQEAYQHILDEVGAVLPRRDSADQQLIREVQQRLGPTPAPHLPNQWPRLASATPYPDRDLDGMDDRWELLHALNPEDAADRNGDFDGDGYTNLEAFLNQMGRQTDEGIDEDIMDENMDEDITGTPTQLATPTCMPAYVPSTLPPCPSSATTSSTTSQALPYAPSYILR